MAIALEIRQLSKTFTPGQKALDNVNLRVDEGEMVVLLGASGSGKSTLLRHIAGFVCGDAGSGSVKVLDRYVQRDGKLARDVRALRTQIGFVFQQFNLVGRLPLTTNVLTGMLHRVPPWRSVFKWFTRDERQRCMAALAQVGIDKYAAQRASTLSGGQQQRAAIARTLVQEARLILADEPIASLDPAAARKVMDTLARINRELGTTVIVSLHQVDIAMRYCQRVVALHQGRVVYDGTPARLTPALLHDIYGPLATELIAHGAPEAQAAPQPALAH
ncbi:phosphonates import ATP-binding protein PhnC [Chitiniphilus shinanonensis]|uniref:Phosphonates import ATP-binding protein PhnC n=1 Tax=Chitiniphilus shinanonensis TaxID=553088 RepID=A0ABQ6BQ61_9NEIS|nr:phosphonate ABC transporter ATP-binding protein [Chitiniphilus shinanonensis]GLS03320.1 phosphonates import ATP-binding protein PhnC [Chitiniphilus shinanonensis]